MSAAKAEFIQLNRLPGVAAYLHGSRPMKNAHFVENVLNKKRS